jgi:hypothetical protein
MTSGLSSFEWFLATDQRGMTADSDGILGLCRKYNGASYKTGPLLIEAL